MKLIVGLGNPGQEYEKTRHNIGFATLDNFLQNGKWKVEGGKRKGEWQETIINGQKVVFLKPMEFMNRSGGAVSAIANFYKIEPKNILVIHDDIDLPVGKIQLKLGGSSAGHNGLKDIIAKLGAQEFYRLRIGVDRPVNQDQVADYVLSNFKKEEKDTIEDKMNEIEKLIQKFLSK
ncbi:MAG: aminoacyl-tRNA hydrolase [Candidatus Absconditabacterales bacterium]